MAFDNYTVTKVRALKECPQGQQPGEVFEVTGDVADILASVGAAEIVAADTPLTKHGKPSGAYQRRDQRAKA
jgi:hypothetical protein